MTDVIAHRVVRLGPPSASPLDYECEIVADPTPPGERVTPFVFRAVRADGVVLERWIVAQELHFPRALARPLAEPGFVSLPLRADYEYQQSVDGDWRTLTRFWHPPRADRAG